MKRVLILMLLVIACGRREPSPGSATRTQRAGAPPKPAARPAVPEPKLVVPVPRSSSGTLDACSLISPEDLKRITGSSFAAGVNTTSTPELMRCTFPRVGGGGINILLHLVDAMSVYRKMPGMVAVPGVPDEAWWSPAVTLFVDRRGSRVLVVGFNYAGGNQKKWGEEITREILPKL